MPDHPLGFECVNGSREAHRIYRLNGPITLSNFFQFQTAVRAETAPLTVIDMTDVPYIDSAGIGLLMGVHVSRQRAGKSLALAGVNERVQNAMHITRVDQLLSIYSSVGDAEKAFLA